MGRMKGIGICALPTFWTDEMDVSVFTLINFPSAFWTGQGIALVNQVLGQ